MASVDELGYTPNKSAQSMRSKKYKNIVLFADITKSIFAEIAKEAQIEFEKHGYTLTLCHIGTTKIKEKIPSFLKGKQFDGIILSTPTEKDTELNKILSNIKIPIITINRDIQGLKPGIIVDYYSSVRRAMEHLISLNHKEIAFVVGNKEIRPTREGISAYKNTLKSHNIPFNKLLIKHGDLTSLDGERIFNELLPYIKKKKITAVFSLNSQMFKGILRGIRKENLHYPKDLSIITVEDDELMELLDPPVTVINRPIHEIGEHVAKQLIRYIEGTNDYVNSKAIIIPTKFIIRNSCRLNNNNKETIFNEKCNS